jgi:hypothetical protein
MHTRETACVDGADQLEEANTMVGVLSEVLVDHVQSDIKYRFKDDGNLVVQERL